MSKDKRLQIRVTEQELEGINRRARAAGLSVAEYGRKRLLAGSGTVLTEQGSLEWDSFEGEPGLSYAAAAADDLSPEEEATHSAKVRDILEEHGHRVPDWAPTIPGRLEGGIAQAMDPEQEQDLKPLGCDIKDLPPGVRCAKCGLVHGS